MDEGAVQMLGKRLWVPMEAIAIQAIPVAWGCAPMGEIVCGELVILNGSLHLHFGDFVTME